MLRGAVRPRCRQRLPQHLGGAPLARRRAGVVDLRSFPLIGWIDRLGWNWGAAVMSGTTAIALTAPNVVPRPAHARRRPPRASQWSPPTVAFPVHSVAAHRPWAVGRAVDRRLIARASHAGANDPGQERAQGKPTDHTGNWTDGNQRLDESRAALAPPRPVGGPCRRPTTPTPVPPSSAPIPDAPRQRRHRHRLPTSPPVVTVKGGGLLCSDNFNGSGCFTDSDLAGHTFTATVNYGDGTATVALKLTGTTFKLSHDIQGDSPHSSLITVTVTDNDGVSGWARSE